MSDQTNIRSARMRPIDGTSGGVCVDGISYPANADGTVTVPTGRPVAELERLGYAVVEVIEAASSQEA